MKTKTPPVRPCTICGRVRRRFLGRILDGSLIPCLSDQNVLHHAGCQNGCDCCVALIRIGIRR